MYPALTRSKGYTTNHELLERLKNNSVNWYQVKSQGYTLPATEMPHSWCGEWGFRGCLNVDGHAGTEAQGKAFVKTFQKHCFRASCEKCASNWMSRESNKSASRLEAYQKQNGESSKHIILSPPQNTSKSPKELRLEAYEILKNVKAKGGCMVFHPFRKYKPIEAQLSKTNSSFWYYSPHFHVVGFGWITNVAENYKKSGWVVKNKGVRKSNFGTIRYILSHAGIKKRSHTLTWFGDCSYKSKLKVPEYVNTERICPHCGEVLSKVLPLGPDVVKPPPQEMECIVNADAWFIPYYAEKNI